MSSIPASERFLIVGQGLAGTAVAWQLWQRNIPFLIVDPELAVTSSKLAAGLITPITGIRVKKSWKLDALLPYAEKFYRDLEEVLQTAFYHSCDMLRFFKNDLEKERWLKRCGEEEYQPWIAKPYLQSKDYPDWIDSPLGGFGQDGAAWLDTKVYLEASKNFFSNLNQYRRGHVEEADLQLRDHGVEWEGEIFKQVILARGWQQKDSRFFPWLDFNSARGVIADIKVESEVSQIRPQVIHHHAWMQIRPDRSWRCGSTYEFDFDYPIENSVKTLEEKLEKLLKVPFRLSHAAAAIRPIIRHRSLVVGMHPVYRRISVFNGLGSKGTLRAPWFADMLCREVLEGDPVDREVEIR